jgi:multiple sugar transport system permease protein
MARIPALAREQPRPRRRIGPLVVRDTINGLLFIAPWLVGLLVFTLYPILASFYYSFTEYDIVSPPKFVGLANYQALLTTDPLFYKGVRNTLFYAAVAIPLNISVAIGVALLLNMRVRGMAFYRTIFFLPSIVPDIASALLWAWILNPQFGLANGLLRRLGLPTIGWLTDPAWSKPSLAMIGLWGFGASVVIFLAALQDIPQHLYEAAELDGANTPRKVWHVTLPMLTPTIFFNLVLGVIGSFQYFTTAYVLTNGEGGPASSTLFYALLLYRNAFKYFKMGYASAMAWLLFAFILVITLIIFKTSGRWVYYEGENSDG